MAQFKMKNKKTKLMKKTTEHLRKTIIALVLLFAIYNVNATGEPSTYFNIYIPPNNDFVQRNVCLVITAIHDSTSFSIIDDGADGDTDDTKTGMLMAGQSYILYIKDNGINDDAKYASGGVLKQDGDYFIITSNKIMYASQSTDSDWQHDWVPATNKTGIGQKFIIYAPKISSSNRDLNTFVYENNTQITIRKISLSPTTITGYTNVDMYTSNIVVQKTLNIGEDIIYFSGEGRNIMATGETYVVESNKPITLQYGALYGNERDGGGYVPSNSGSAAGDIFYFGVPYQSGTNGEQEIRVISLDATNNVTLERYNAGTWLAVKSWTMNAKTAVDWVGRNNGNVSYPSVFRIKCTSGKKVSVFEANWLETGNPGTSDIGTMCSSYNGTSSGNGFLIYMAPPGNEQNVKNPFSGTLFGQQLTHAYIFSSKDTCHVTVKDAYTNGTKINRTYTILPGKYIDCYLTLAEWKNIYNGTGTIAGGAERPYLEIISDKAISVMNTNFNDNWMMYFGSSLEQSFNQTSTSSKDKGIPGDTITISNSIVFKSLNNIDSASIKINIGSGLKVINSTLSDNTASINTNGIINTNTNYSEINFPLQDSLSYNHNYKITTTVIPQLMYNNGDLITNNTVSNVETTVTGKINGTLQQSSSLEGITIESTNTSNLIFKQEVFNTELTNSWTSNTIDIDNDGWEDIFITDKDITKPNLFYKNNGDKTFTKTIINSITTDLASTVCSSWADFTNDGKVDALIVNNTRNSNALFINNGGLNFQKVGTSSVTEHPAYYHSGSFVDYDNDGWLDIFVSNFMPTKFHELYHNNKNGTFTAITNGPIVNEAYMSLGATWADYDNDGDGDLFIPNANNENNSFFINNGNGTFTKATSLNICNDAGNSVASCWGDVNNDGYLDLFVSNASNQNNFFYINNKLGGFTKITEGEIVNDGGHSHGCSFVDIDNDMDLDLYVTNDIGIKFLYTNDGNGNFTRKKDEIIGANFGKSMGQSWFDADKDGDLDLIVVTHSGQKNQFFSNNGNTNKWTSIKLVGNISNKSAIGARIELKSGGKWQYREVNSQSGLGGQNSIRCHFGLASNTIIDTVIVKWPSGYKQVLTNLPVNTFQTITEPLGGFIKGIVYFDKNNNCIKDVDENTISNIKIEFDNKQYAFTNSNGNYFTNICTGSHTLSINNQNYWKNNCGNVTVNLNAITDTLTINLPINSDVIGSDLKVDLGLTAMRKGFKNQLNMSVENLGSSTAYNVPIALALSNGMKITMSNPAYKNVTGNIYTWNIDSIKPGQNISYQLLDSVSVTKVIGDELTFTLNADLSSDLNLGNNSIYKINNVVGAIDPNDLSVSPKGEGYLGYVKKDTILTYLIRFQNVGNYAATYVTISNQLPKGLDYKNISNLNSSHIFNFNITENGLFTAIFNEINLPDSTSNSIESNGYISFSLPILNNISEGEEINNQAEIQFDYEDKIATNKVKNTIFKILEDEDIIVYPNPANNFIKLDFISNIAPYLSNNYITSIKLINSLGTVVLNLKNNEIKNNEINLQNYKPSLYYLVIKDSKGKTYTKKIVIEH